MPDKPIIFRSPMIRALLDGRKAQTRRVLKPQPKGIQARFSGITQAGQIAFTETYEGGGNATLYCKSLCAPGDRLWVREGLHRDPLLWAYRADGAKVGWPGRGELSHRTRDYLSSIHMPRVCSRLTLVVTDVRVQRVQEISAEDTIAEGAQCSTCEAMRASQCHGKGCFSSKIAFHDLWDSINAKRGFGWDANPWVCALTFTVHRCNIDAMGEE